MPAGSKLFPAVFYHLPTLTCDDNFFGATKDFMTNTISINIVCPPATLTVAGMDALQIHSPDDWLQDLELRV